MLQRLYIQNYTVFANADFEFGPELNVIVCTNGTGKIRVLKLSYIVKIVKFDLNKQFPENHLKKQAVV